LLAIRPGRSHITGVPSRHRVTAIDQPLANALRDRYVLEKELGRGGMATVYLARDSAIAARWR
jgi:hypothetical protein